MDNLAFFAFPGLVLLFGLSGALISSKNIPTWYRMLEKPKLNPPNWIFGPVWTTLYLMIGYSGYLVWAQDRGFEKHYNAWVIFFLQLILNYAWTPIFFGLHWLFSSLLVIVFMAITIFANIILFYTIQPTAGLLLVPYLVWVSFATYLTYSIWILNKDKMKAEGNAKKSLAEE